MQSLNWVDFIILGIMFFSALAGLGRGFVREIVSLITLFASFIIATMFCNTLALKFTQSASVQDTVNQASSAMGVNASEPVSYMAIGISFILLFVGTYLIGTFIGIFLNMVFQYGILGLGNRLFGAVFGLARGVILNIIFIFLVQLTPFKANAAWQNSQMVDMFEPAVNWVGHIAAPSIKNIREKVSKGVNEVGSTIQDVTNQYQGGF